MQYHATRACPTVMNQGSVQRRFLPGTLSRGVAARYVKDFIHAMRNHFPRIAQLHRSMEDEQDDTANNRAV